MSQSDDIAHIEGKLNQALQSQEFFDGVHKLIMSALLAITITPKTCISAYPYLTALGRVSDCLQGMFDWDEKLVTKIKEACKAKNQRINDAGLIQSFFDQFGSTSIVRRSGTEESETDGATPVAKVEFTLCYGHK